MQNEIYRALYSLLMAYKRKGYSPEVARKAIVFLYFRGVGMTIEEVFEAAKALEPEEEGRRFNFIVLDISVECSMIYSRNSTIVGQSDSFICA